VKAGYALSHVTASSSKPFTDGQLIKKYLIRTAKIMCPDKVIDCQIISLTRNTVAEHIDDIANNLRVQIRNISKHFEAFSMPMDESTDVKVVSHLAVFIRGFD
jgi:hypothetical protein